MHSHPLIWLFVGVIVVLGVLFWRLLHWNRKLKAALNKRFDLTGNSDSTYFSQLSKKATKANSIASIAIIITIIGTFFYLNFIYEENEDIVIAIFELSIVLIGLSSGFLLGASRSRAEVEHHFSQALMQASKREWVERKVSLSEERLENQQLALSTLTQNQLYAWHEPSEVFREMAMISAQTLNVERVGVWLFNADRTQLDCSDLYLKSLHHHVLAEPLIKQALPQYFNALEHNRLLVSEDVFQHEATAELRHDYMPAHNIGATLEGGIWLNNQLIGVICHEHVGGARAWTLDEKSFVTAIAALASLAIETHRRRQIENDLLEHQKNLEVIIQKRTAALDNSAKRFQFVVERAPVAILCLNGAREVIEINPEAEKISGYSRAYALGKTYDALFSSEETRAYNEALIRKMDQYGNFQGERTLVRCADGSTIELSVSHSVGLDGLGNPMAIAIAQDMSMHKALETSLIKAREAAEMADRTKSMFVAAMSHELRTPLNSIIGFLGVVLQGNSGDLNPIQKSQLDRAYQSSKHLLLLISDVLDVSKVEAGFLQMHIEKFELKPLLSEAEQAVQHMMAGKKLTLSIDCAVKLSISTDKKRLYQVLLNVLANAVKYTEQGSIKIKAHLEDNQLIVSCDDTGIGIAESDFDKLFQPFERMQSSLKIKMPGTGLGLYLSRKILKELLGGTINVQSKLGQGSTFTIIIPVNTPLTAVKKLTKLIKANAVQPVS